MAVATTLELHQVKSNTIKTVIMHQVQLPQEVVNQPIQKFHTHHQSSNAKVVIKAKATRHPLHILLHNVLQVL